jgi:hypothetical protein
MTVTLKEACARHSRIGAQPVRLPEVPATMRFAERLARLLADTVVERPSQENLGLISRRIHAALAAGEALSRKDLRHAPWCIFATKTPLADHPDRLALLLARMAEVEYHRLYQRLAHAYLNFFEPSRTGLSTVGAFLTRHVERLRSPWVEAHRALDIFAPDTGPEKVASIALAAARTPDDILADAGIGNAASHVGFREHAYRMGFATLENGGNRDPMWRLEIVKKWAFPEARVVRFDSLRTSAVRAAVDPWKDTDPDSVTKDAFLEPVLSLLGDPRTKPARWNGCEKAEKIVRRWLTEQSLRQFCDVVDRVAKPEHWTYRRAFWEGLYNKRYPSDIEEAWVVFESSGASAARRQFGKDISFGQFAGGTGIQSGHSVLLLKVGTLTVAEWSHSSPCSIWDERHDERGPRLYKQAYDAGELKKPYIGSTSGDNLEKQGVFWHRGSDNYAWQDRIARFLRQRRNIIISRADYEVR